MKITDWKPLSSRRDGVFENNHRRGLGRLGRTGTGGSCPHRRRRGEELADYLIGEDPLQIERHGKPCTAVGFIGAAAFT